MVPYRTSIKFVIFIVKNHDNEYYVGYIIIPPHIDVDIDIDNGLRL